MSLDIPDRKDASEVKDGDIPSTAHEPLSARGRRAMQGDDVAALEQRLEEVRAETNPQEAAERSALERQAAERAQMAESQATAAEADASPDPPPDHHPQMATTERGNEVKIEGGAEMNERRLFSDIDPVDEDREEHGYFREGRI